MVDVENEIFGRISAVLRAKYDPIFVYGEYIRSPAVFPAVMIEEKDNSAYARTQDSGDLENHVSVMYEVNVYSNKKSGKKSECKAILAVIDSEFQKFGFTRTAKESIFNLEDATVYRMVGRYSAIISKNKTIYRR